MRMQRLLDEIVLVGYIKCNLELRVTSSISTVDDEELKNNSFDKSSAGLARAKCWCLG